MLLPLGLFPSPVQFALQTKSALGTFIPRKHSSWSKDRPSNESRPRIGPIQGKSSRTSQGTSAESVQCVAKDAIVFAAHTRHRGSGHGTPGSNPPASACPMAFAVARSEEARVRIGFAMSADPPSVLHELRRANRDHHRRQQVERPTIAPSFLPMATRPVSAARWT
jgi:hypothetical protein